jgi:general stress protein 26
MNEKDLKQDCLKLMETADTAYLSTIDNDGFPQIRAMVNLRNKEQFSNIASIFNAHHEDLLIYVTTDTASDKFQQIKLNPKVSVYFCNPQKIQGLLLTGEMELVTDMNIKKQLWQADWEIHYPGGVDSPEYNILCLKPSLAKYWSVPMPKPVEFRLN